ncbi:MAG: hypothetical protein ISS53_03570 [Dehalococcoidia bacterium]|nr:hypothetical protein [Dehalococcoidia bacterium]
MGASGIRVKRVWLIPGPEGADGRAAQPDRFGSGIGVQQAIDSGINVARTVLQYHRLRQAVQ